MPIPIVLALSNGEVLIVVTLVVIPIAALAFALGAGKAFSQIGKGPLAIEPFEEKGSAGAGTGAGASAAAPVSAAVREEEIRQMLEARSYRREARGEPPIDIEAELERLLAIEPEQPTGSLSGDPELREEVRTLVVARNERRLRRGEPPLDVDDEVERQLQELENMQR